MHPAQSQYVESKPIAHQFADMFRAKHPDLWTILDRWAESCDSTIDEIVEVLMREHPGDLRAVYAEMMAVVEDVKLKSQQSN